MKLSCPSCSAKYSIADEKVHDRLAKIRCRKCSATIIVDGKVDPPSVYTSEGGAAAPGDVTDSSGNAGVGGEYSVDFGDNDQRSMSAEDIVQAYRRGELTADMYVWAEGMSDWQPIGSVPELAEALGAGSQSAQQRAAARSGAGRGSAHDLFGGIDKAGSEEDVMTSAPQPAGMPAAAQGIATGARNESSVLFSLSALTASAPAAAPPMRSAFSAAPDNKGDDSGLIDLKALTSTAASQPPGPLGLGTAPLGMAAPLGGMTSPAMHHSDGPAPRQQNSKTGLYIGGAIVMVGALIAGAIVMTSNKETASAVPPPVAAPVAVPAAAPPPAAPEKKDEPTAQPPGTGTAAADQAPTAAAAKPAAVSHPSGGAVAHIARAKASSSSGSSDKSASSEKSTPPPAANNSDNGSSSGSSDSSGGEKKHKKKSAEKSCNCSPGDLMCAMKCAAS